MQQPLITVYITNHNYGKYIEEAVESVLRQTIQDFEIIIIDDGSTDNSREVIERYTDHEQIKIIFQQNKGLNVTNNIAMRAASGKYIMRLDADDYLDHNALLVLSTALENDNELGLVFPDYYMVDEKGQVLGIERRHNFANAVTLLDQPAHGACTMIRKEFLMKLNGYDEDYECQDGYELWIKFTNHFKVNNINTPLFYYRQHGANLTSNEGKILKTRAKIKDDYLKKHNRKPLKTIALIPVRNNKSAKYNLVFEKLNGHSVLDWKIAEALEADKIEKVVISSPSEEVGEHIEEQYAHHDKVTFIKRDIHLARLNTDLFGTIEHILEQPDIKTLSPEALMVLSIEFPFINSTIINEAVNSMEIFDTDSLISVRPDTSLFFQHHGEGMKSILNQEKFTKLEREALYKYTGGLSLCRIPYFREHRKFIGGKVGHVVIGQKAAQGIFTDFDLQIARMLASASTKTM